jgi:hypothetical protein
MYIFFICSDVVCFISGRHNIHFYVAEIVLKVALKHKKSKLNETLDLPAQRKKKDGEIIC